MQRINVGEPQHKIALCSTHIVQLAVAQPTGILNHQHFDKGPFGELPQPQALKSTFYRELQGVKYHNQCPAYYILSDHKVTNT